MWSPVLLFTILICGTTATEEEMAYNRFNEFDWNLSKAVGSLVNDNVVLSPISIKVVLAMLYEGAQGKSAQELEDALQLKRDLRMLTPANFSKILSSLQETKKGIDLDIGTKLYIDLGAVPNKSFKSKIEQLYNATIDTVDFKNTSHAVKVINAWAKSVTHGHIEHLLSDADSMDSTVLLLLNAVYFKGVWENPFLSNMTALGQFKAQGKKLVNVEYMHALLDLMYLESPSLNSRIIRLPYLGNKSAMYIILPEKDDGLDEAISKLTPQALRELLSSMQKQPILLKLPKFKIEMASSLLPALKKLGINDIFENTADLSGIVKDSNDTLVVSNVIQKAGVEVNEQGSTAYVATEVELVSKFGEHAVEVNVTRPFLFFIKDEVTDTVLFVGKVVNPLQEGLSQVSAPLPQPPADEQTTKAPLTTTTPDPYVALLNALSNRIDTGPQNPTSQTTVQPTTKTPEPTVPGNVTNV